MRLEHHALRQVGALSIRDSELPQANMFKITDHQGKGAHDMNT